LPHLYSLSSFDNSDDYKAFSSTERTSFDNRYSISNLGTVIFVMGHKQRRAALNLSIRNIPHPPLNRHNHTLVQLVTPDHANYFSLSSH
jgi:hypothetical protein